MLSELLTPQVGFTFGLMLHACIKIVSRKDDTWHWWKFIALFFVAGLFSLMLYDSENRAPLSIPNFILLYGVIFTGLACISFRKQIFIKINEIVLMVWNLGLLYLAISIFGFQPIILVPLALFLLAFFISLFHIKLNQGTQIAMYVWFLLLGVYISVALLPWKELFLSQSAASDFGFVQMFFFGLAVFYTFSSFVFLSYLFIAPPDGFIPSFKEKKYTTDFLHEQFDAKQFHPLATTAALLFLVIIFYLNYRYSFSTDEALLAIVFGASPYLGEYVHTFFHGSIDEYRG